MWYHFQFENGSNPYIAFTEKERDRIIRKYEVEKIKDGFYIVKDGEYREPQTVYK